MEEALTAKEVCSRFKISRTKLQYMLNAGEIRGKQLQPGKNGSPWRFTIEECRRVFLGEPGGEM